MIWRELCNDWTIWKKQAFQQHGWVQFSSLPWLVSNAIWTLKLWYQSIHRSLHCSNTDFGYDISDYRAIQPEYGTMEDFDLLIQKATELGNVIDFSSAFLISYTENGSRVPFLVFYPALISNLKFHLSLFSFWKESKSFWILFQIIQATRWVLWVLLFVHSWIIVIVLFHKLQHEWFLRSEAGDPEYTDYFIWNEGKMEGDERKPPNNWVSVFRGPAWTYSEKRQAWYFHQFTKQQVSWVLIKIRVWLLSTSTMLCVCFCFVSWQPDLNFRNPAVVEEMKNVLRFWLGKGVSGFRCDAVRDWKSTLCTSY